MSHTSIKFVDQLHRIIYLPLRILVLLALLKLPQMLPKRHNKPRNFPVLRVMPSLILPQLLQNNRMLHNQLIRYYSPQLHPPHKPQEPHVLLRINHQLLHNLQHILQPDPFNHSLRIVI